jgi:tetratricopeptide (TPR) repeat protein
MTGDIIGYDTPVSDVVSWIEKTYLRRNFTGFTGDRKFVHDIDAQKSFSKLRSSIGGVYAWRLDPRCPVEYQPKTPDERARLLKEANYAFLQAFAFCPWSPEAVMRYAVLLGQTGRIDDALLVIQTSLKLDPFNGQIQGWRDQFQNAKKQQAALDQTRNNLHSIEEELRKNPGNASLAFNLAQLYIQVQQTDRAVQVMDGLLKNNTNLDANTVIGMAQFFQSVQDWPKLEQTLERLIKVDAGQPEAWYDLAALKASLGKTGEAMPALKQALELSAQRLKQDSNALDLKAKARQDPALNRIRQAPEFRALTGS